MLSALKKYEGNKEKRLDYRALYRINLHPAKNENPGVHNKANTYLTKVC